MNLFYASVGGREGRRVCLVFESGGAGGAGLDLWGMYRASLCMHVLRLHLSMRTVFSLYGMGYRMNKPEMCWYVLLPLCRYAEVTVGDLLGFTLSYIII